MTWIKVNLSAVQPAGKFFIYQFSTLHFKIRTLINAENADSLFFISEDQRFSASKMVLYGREFTRR